jgi:hypothetical protein
MKTIKVKERLAEFETFANNFSENLKTKMLTVCKEQPEYMADELLLLSEEILSQVSAYGVCLYLQKGGILQTEKNNDYLLHELFLNNGHQNAGPVFYNVRNLVQELTAVLSDKQNELFNSESDINKKLQELAAFRNALMHGFFKLPAERNLELVKEIQIILEKLLNYYEIFKHKGDFHFWKKEGFSGHWNLQDNDDWNALAGEKASSFEKLADKAQNELHSPDFLKTVSISHEPNSAMEKKEDIEGFISSDFKESLYVQFNPRDKKQQYEFYDNAYALLKQRENVELLSYTIDENGIGFTSYLLFARLVSFLTPIKTNLSQELNDEKKLKELKLSVEKPKDKLNDKVESLINDIGKLDKKKKLVLLINNIHLVPFASDHITSLMKFFKESGIYFIGIGWEYEHLNSVFSQKLDLRKDRNVIPNEIALKQLIDNHTRHRGPFEKDADFADLMRIINLICQLLEDKKSVIARQLADVEKVNIELVNEALYILYPYFKYDQSGNGTNYIKDDLDELYGFPKTQTETSSIFLTLGRRDIDLEYKHKILKP